MKVLRRTKEAYKGKESDTKIERENMRQIERETKSIPQ
jgi:hypothetical protein